MVRKKKSQKKQELLKKIFILGIIGIFVVSMFAVSFSGFNSNDQNVITLDVKNKTYKFKVNTASNDAKYLLLKDKEEIPFFFTPNEILNLDVDPEAMKILKSSSSMYLTFNPDNQEMEYVDFLRLSLSEEFLARNVALMPGIIRPDDSYSLPIIDCNNATSIVRVIDIEPANETMIKKENNCVIIEAHNIDYIKIRDYILYSLHGVI